MDLSADVCSQLRQSPSCTTHVMCHYLLHQGDASSIEGPEGGEDEDVEDLAPDLSNLRRTAGRGEKRPREQSEDLVGALFALGDKILKGNEAMGHNFIKFH